MWELWLICAGIFFIVEMITTGFLIFWLGLGALFAMVSSFFTDNLIIQTTIFFITSTTLIILTKPLIRKFVKIKNSKLTNAYSIINKQGIVTEDINSILGTGQIKINGEVWSAKTESDKIIPKSTNVEVEKIEGVKVVVKEAITSTK